LGTVNYLDGEMIGLDGKFYQVKADGVASIIPDAIVSPFATVTFFKPEKLITLKGIRSINRGSRKNNKVERCT
jgi:acetolactate decarboxylase